MHLLGFFFLAPLSASSPKSALYGFSLIELVVSLSVLGLLIAFSLPVVWRWQERARIDQVRQQLFYDLQLARLRALQIGQRLQMRRLTDCTPISASATDWSCGWQTTTVPDSTGSALVISTTSLDATLQVSFAKNTNFFISAQGDLGTIGDRWTVLSRNAGVNFSRSLCISSAGRIRTAEAATCS